MPRAKNPGCCCAASGAVSNDGLRHRARQRCHLAGVFQIISATGFGHCTLPSRQAGARLVSQPPTPAAEPLPVVSHCEPVNSYLLPGRRPCSELNSARFPGIHNGTHRKPVFVDLLVVFVGEQSLIEYCHWMAKTARGLYRTPWWAYVTDGTIGMDVPEARYRQNGYQPDYDDLPTREAYEAAKAEQGYQDGPNAERDPLM